MIDSTIKNANILVADDQQADIDVLTGFLDAKGYTNYITTKDSRQVFSLFDEFKPDILLLDLKMPHLTGLEVMMQLKILIPPETYIPILILAADLTPAEKQEALAGGAADFLTKPFDLLEVDLRIKNLLKIRFLYKQLENQNQIVEEKVKERIIELERENLELKAAKKEAEKLKSEYLNQMSLTENQKKSYEQINESTKPESGRTNEKQTILYIEDNLSNIQLVGQILETHRPSINLVTNIYGKNAVKLAIDHKPNLILLDLNLPDIHGSEVIKLLQAEPRTAEIPVIILSAYTMSRQIEILLVAGAKDYLIKPIDVVQFLKKVDEIFNEGDRS